MRIAMVPSWEFADVVVGNGVWGSNRSRFGTWEQGETLVLLIGKEGVLVATVSGNPFTSDSMIWEGDAYRYRIPVHVEKVMRGATGIDANQAVRKALLAAIRGTYGGYVMSQSKLPRKLKESVNTALL